jgi:predicted PurR-regulated permease PerM
MQPPILSTQQLRLACLFTFVVAALALSANMLLPFVTAILWATTLSVLTYPWFAKLKKNYDRKLVERPDSKLAAAGDTIAALRSTLRTLVVICLPFVIAAGLAIRQISPAIDDLQGSPSYEIADRIDRVLSPLLEKVNVHDFHVQSWWSDNSSEVVTNLKGPATKFAKQAGLTVFTIIIALLSMFFFQRDGQSLRQPFFNLCGLPEERAQALLDRVEKTIRAVFSGTVIVALIQGSIMAITYALLGVPNSVLLGFFSVILCIIPLLGAPVVYIPVGLLFLAQGDVTKASIVFAVGFLIVSQIDNVLKPVFIGTQVSLHPLAIFFFVLGGIGLFGPIGLVVGPMILTILLALYDYACLLMGDQAANETTNDATG